MSGAARNGTGSKNGNNKTMLVVVILLAVVVIALIAVVMFLLGRGSAPANTVVEGEAAGSRREVASSTRTVVDESTANNIIDQMRKEVEEGMFECQMSMNWTFDNGTAVSRDAYVANSANNRHPICFDVYLRDTNELIYSSPVLPVGSNLTDIRLDQALPAGEYKATVMYTLLEDEETQEEISSAGFVINLQVLR